MNIITRLEEAILIAIWKLEDNAYGVSINKQVSQSSQKKYSMGALYFALDQLLRKGHVHKTIRHFYQKKGGRSRTYYTLTEEGQKALLEVRAYQKSLWDGISELTFKVKNTK
jgi:DNA-binding PadR family transcriptional regulator